MKISKQIPLSAMEVVREKGGQEPGEEAGAMPEWGRGEGSKGQGDRP